MLVGLSTLTKVYMIDDDDKGDGNRRHRLNSTLDWLIRLLYR